MQHLQYTNSSPSDLSQVLSEFTLLKHDWHSKCVLWYNLISGFSVQQNCQRGIMWKSEQRKVHLHQMFMKFIFLVQVFLWNTNSLKHKIPNTSPLKLISWINTIPWHKSMICYSWSYQSDISYCASLIKIRQVLAFFQSSCHPLVHVNFFATSRNHKNTELRRTVCKLKTHLFTNYLCYICNVTSCNATGE